MSDAARVLADLGQLAIDTFHSYCADPGLHGEAAGIGLILGHLHTLSGGEHGLPPDEVVAAQQRWAAGFMGLAADEVAR